MRLPVPRQLEGTKHDSLQWEHCAIRLIILIINRCWGHGAESQVALPVGHREGDRIGVKTAERYEGVERLD